VQGVPCRGSRSLLMPEPGGPCQPGRDVCALPASLGRGPGSTPTSRTSSGRRHHLHRGRTHAFFLLTGDSLMVERGAAPAHVRCPAPAVQRLPSSRAPAAVTPSHGQRPGPCSLVDHTGDPGSLERPWLDRRIPNHPADRRSVLLEITSEGPGDCGIRCGRIARRSSGECFRADPLEAVDLLAAGQGAPGRPTIAAQPCRVLGGQRKRPSRLAGQSQRACGCFSRCAPRRTHPAAPGRCPADTGPKAP